MGFDTALGPCLRAVHSQQYPRGYTAGGARWNLIGRTLMSAGMPNAPYRRHRGSGWGRSPDNGIPGVRLPRDPDAADEDGRLHCEAPV